MAIELEFERVFPVPESALKTLFTMLWESQWSCHNAAENYCCAHGCGSDEDRWHDQTAHHKGCPFLVLWDRLARLRCELGALDEPARDDR